MNWIASLKNPWHILQKAACMSITILFSPGRCKLQPAMHIFESEDNVEDIGLTIDVSNCAPSAITSWLYSSNPQVCLQVLTRPIK
jgi:hypothetical protein